jgi:NitT/TauT family transport system substrate-binding protein
MMVLQRLIAAGIALALTSAFAGAQELTRIKFTLDWKVQGPHAWFYMARDKGYFREAGLDVVVDQGEGSAATVTRIISGAYDAGFGDMNAIIQTAALRPGDAPVMVYMLYNKAPFALVPKNASPIKTVKDMAGKKMGSPAGAAALKLFPLLAKKNGLDPAQVEIINMAPNLQETMLLQSRVDISAVFTATSYMNLVALKLDPEKDFRWIYYSDSGLDLYSNGVMVSARLAREKPEAVKGLVRAIAKAMRETVGNPDAAINLLAIKEPLVAKDIEKQRLLYVVKTLIATPEASELGVGDVKDSRLREAISAIVSSYELPRTPAVDAVFNRSFLPPKADRTLPAVTN